MEFLIHGFENYDSRASALIEMGATNKSNRVWYYSKVPHHGPPKQNGIIWMPHYTLIHVIR